MTHYKQLLKVRWDAESPKFKLACFKLGIEKGKLEIKAREEIAMKGESEKIVGLKYRHHLNRVKDLLNEVIVERRKLIQIQMQPFHTYLDPVSPRSDYSNPFSHKSPTLATSRQRSAIDLLSQI